MSDDYKIVRVFIASPGDLSSERKAFPRIIKQANDIKAHELGFHLEAVGWENTLPGVGRPQALINTDVENCHIFVMLLWRKWGTPSGEFSSGTEEEYTIARRRFDKSRREPHILLYFREVEVFMMADPGPQLKQVIDFRDRIEKENSLLFKRYAKPRDWEEMLLTHLSQWLGGARYGGGVRRAAARPLKVSAESGQRMAVLQRRLAEDAGQETAQGKARAAAVSYGIEAARLMQEGKITLAEQQFARSVELYQEPEVMNNFGFFLYQMGSLDRAKEILEKALNAARQGKDSVQQANAHSYLGNVYLTRGDLRRAEEMYRQSLEINRALGRREGMAEDYKNLGNVYMTKGDTDDAERMYGESLEINRALKNRRGMAKAYGSLGNLYLIKNQLDRAEEMYTKSRRIDEAAGNKQGLAKTYGNLGVVYAQRQKFDAALRMHKKALEVSTLLNHRQGMSDNFANLGVVYLEQRRLDEAEEMLGKSLDLDQSLGRKDGMAKAFYNLGKVYRARGEVERAKEAWTKAGELFKELDYTEAVELMQRHVSEAASQPAVKRKAVKRPSAKPGPRVRYRRERRA